MKDARNVIQYKHERRPTTDGAETAEMKAKRFFVVCDFDERAVFEQSLKIDFSGEKPF